MPVVERRKSRRYAIASERAECLAIVGNREYQAVLSDMSACGFGLTLLSGVQVEPDQRLRLITSDAISECRIAYCRREESLQYLGVERLADLSLAELPRRGKKTIKFFRYGISGASPVLFIVVVLGFTAFSAMFLVGMDTAAGVEDGGVITIDQTPEHKPKPQVSMRQNTAETAKKSVRIIKSYFDELSLKQRATFNAVAKKADLDWDDLVDGLELTRQQQQDVIKLVEEQTVLATPVEQRFIDMREGIRTLLREDQLTRLDQMWINRRPQLPDASPVDANANSATN